MTDPRVLTPAQYRLLDIAPTDWQPTDWYLRHHCYRRTLRILADYGLLECKAIADGSGRASVWWRRVENSN